MTELEQAIADIKEARISHVHWAEYFEKHPEEEKRYAETGEWDTAKTHREWADKYDRILLFLGHLKMVSDAADSALDWFDDYGTREGIIPLGGEHVADKLRIGLGKIHNNEAI